MILQQEREAEEKIRLGLQKKRENREDPDNLCVVCDEYLYDDQELFTTQ